MRCNNSLPMPRGHLQALDRRGRREVCGNGPGIILVRALGLLMAVPSTPPCAQTVLCILRAGTGASGLSLRQSTLAPVRYDRELARRLTSARMSDRPERLACVHPLSQLERDAAEPYASNSGCDRIG
jgi:hypothetical protein